MSTQYYLQFVPYNGSPLSLDGGSLYAVSDVNFGATQTLNIGSQSSGAGAGKITFDALSFTLGSSNLTTRLDQMLPSGTPFQQVILYGVNGQGGTVIADTFKLAAAKSDTIDAVTGAHAITLDYGGVVESSTLQTSDGSQGATTTAGWNGVRNVLDNSPTASIDTTTPGITPAFRASDIATGAAGPTQSRHLYVQLRDYAGTLLGAPNGGWIAVDAASLESEQTLNIGSQSTGAGAGKVTFDPLQLTFAPGTLEPLLLQYQASGAALQVEVAAYGSTGQLVDDYRFGTAAIKTSDRTIEDGAATLTYTIEYGQEQMAHTSQDATGVPVTTIQGWDRVRNVSLTSPTALPQKAATTEAALQTTLANVGTGEGGQTQYYLQFVPYNGSPLSLDGGSLYAVSDVNFGATQTLNIGSQSSGAGAGKITFDALSFTLGSSNLTTRLDQMLPSGTPFQQVILYGVNGQGGTVIADTFKLAAAKSDTIDAVTGAHAITLDYGGVVESSTLQTSDGSQGATTTAGWNGVRNVLDNSPTASIDTTTPGITPAFRASDIATGAAGPAQSRHLYVQLRDYAGTLLGAPNGGWIAVDAASLESEQTLNIGSQSTGAGAGKVTFDPLQLTFAPGTLEPLLLQYQASGAALQVEVAAYGSTGQLVDDYRFGTAAIKTSDRTIEDGAATLTYTIEYGQEQMAHTSQDATGVPVTTIQGWDRVRNVSLTSPTALPQKAATTEAALQTTLANVGTGETSTDPGPTAAAGAITVGHDMAVDATAYVTGLITPGLPGDVETIVSVTGRASLSNGRITYTAPSSGPDSFGYTVRDQLGDFATGTVAVTVDPGPTLTAAAPLKVGHGQTVSVGSATAGLPGDTLSIQASAAPTSGSLSLAGSVVSYAETAPVPTGGATDTFTYQIADGYGDLSAPVTTTFQLDPGPTAGSGAITVGHNMAVDETAYVQSLIAPGLAGDSETITAVTGHASLGANGKIIYTAPSAGPDSFGYTVQDQLGDVATGTIAVTVDPGPTAGTVTSTVNLGTSVDLTQALLGAAKPGLAGDLLSITGDQTAGSLGTISLVNGHITYAATGTGLSHIPANGTQADSFTYTIADQFGDTTTGTASILVANPAKVIAGPTAGFGRIQGTAGADIITASGLFNAIYANGGNDVINAGLGFATIYTGPGDVVTHLGGLLSQVTGGDGNNTVTGVGGLDSVKLGNGNNTVLLDGSGNSIVLGNGTNMVSAGSGFDRVAAGRGTDTIKLAGFGNTVTLNGSSATVSGGRGLDLVTINGGNDTLTFAGVSDHAVVNGVANVNILDQGQGLRIDIGSSTQTDTITGFGSDTFALLDLKNHAGGYTSTASVLHALTTDGHGGTLLALGTTGSIDFLGTPMSALHAANFRIG